MRRRPVLIAGLVLLLVAAAAIALLLSGGQAPRAGTIDTPASGGAASLAISPVRSVVDAGDPTRVTFTLANGSRTPKTYAVSTAELDTNGLPLPPKADNAGGWARPARSGVTVAPRGTAQVRVRVVPPADRGATTRRIGVTFTDTGPVEGTVGMRAQVTTSVYVLGTGPAIRRLTLSRIQVPFFAHGAISVSALLRNRGTTTLVPGSLHDSVVGTVSQGRPFSLSGDVVGPGSSARVSGILQPSHFACWCEVRISAPADGADTVSVTRRVLILPWPLIWTVIGVALLLLVVTWWRRRPEPALTGPSHPTPPANAPSVVDETPAPAPSTTVTKTTAKKATAKKAAVKKVPAKKTPANKAAATKKAPVKKAPAKKSPATKRAVTTKATTAKAPQRPG